MTHAELPPSLDRFLAGEASPAEAEEVRRWAAADPRRAALLAALRTSAGDERRWDVDAAWARVAPRLDPAVLPLRRTANRRRALPPVTAWRVAAALALLVGGGLLAREALLRTSPQVAPLALELRTERGELRTVRLPDGSAVRLGVESTLRAPEGFGAAHRRVELVGEAYFEVVSRTDTPFEVHAGGTVTRVLGTEFGVRAVPGEGVSVVVAGGRVRLEADGRGAELAAGQRGSVLPDGRLAVEREVDAAALLAWTDGWLHFHDARFADVLREMERWYPVHLRAEGGDLPARRVSASFRGETADEAAEALAAALDLRHARQGDTIRFEPAGRPR